MIHSELMLAHDITLYTKIHFLCPDIRSWELGTGDIRIILSQLSRVTIFNTITIMCFGWFLYTFHAKLEYCIVRIFVMLNFR